MHDINGSESTVTLRVLFMPPSPLVQQGQGVDVPEDVAGSNGSQHDER